MSYLVLARKYRPQILADLAGQGAIATTLTNALIQNRVSHALMLCGPRGVGKTSTARILAKSLNCTVSPGATPCGKCDACVSITTGNNMDVIEIDGASNNGVDNIRDLRDNVKFATASAKYKIYIIDEVHMLSTPAFNALLKTLEEPPAHVKFIFATTEIQKVPETIRSRTQRFDFKLVPPNEIAKHLKYIATQENLTCDEDALLSIAGAGAGSIRDALTLLDQAIVYANGKITIETVTSMTGALSFEKTFTIGKNIIEKQGGKALENINSLLNAGIAVDQIFNQLIDLFRALMIIPENPIGMETMFNLTPNQLDEIRSIHWSQESAIYALQILNKSRSEAHLYPEAHIALEMAIIRCTRIENIMALSDIVSGKKKIAIDLTKHNNKITDKISEPNITSTESVKLQIPTSVKEDTNNSYQISPNTTKPHSTNNNSDNLNPLNKFINKVSERYPSFAKLIQQATYTNQDNLHTFTIKDADLFKMERFLARKDKLEISLKAIYGDDAVLDLQQQVKPPIEKPIESKPKIKFTSRSAPLVNLPNTENVDLPWNDNTPQPIDIKQIDKTTSSANTLLNKIDTNKNIQNLKNTFKCNIINITEINKE